jgi:predicted phosphodiesterase
VTVKRRLAAEEQSRRYNTHMARLTRRWIAASAVFLVFAFVIGVRAVSEPRNDFRFSIVGDRTHGAIPQVYGRIWREIDLLHPDFAINVGDTIEGGSDARAEQEWQALHPIWERYRDHPLYFIPGNHDIWSDASEKVYRSETGRPPFYSFNYQEAHFTVLDNSRTEVLSDDQMRFLAEDLEANKDRNPKFIFFHKPYWLVFLKLGSGEFPLHRLARQYNVAAVISGHGHQFVRMKRDGVVYMEVGSSGGTMKGLAKGEGFAQGWFYHHVWARVKGSKVSFTVKELDPPLGKGRMFRAEDWDAKGPSFDPNDPAAKEEPGT